jgi:sugar phosphate isomerase/epimerase
MTTRRQFIATMGAGLGLMSARRSLIACASLPAESLQAIGIQLYTVRSLMKDDFEGTLAKIAGIGYREVEFAGYFNRTPEQVRAVLASNKLTSPSTHIGWPKDDEAWKQTVDQAKEIGHEWVTIAYLDAAMRKTPDDWKRIADRFNQLGTMAQRSGLRFAYHNHDFELAPFGETNGLETLLTGTDPKAVDFEMDIYWVVKGGGDPIDYLTRFPNRFAMFHAKDATAAPERKMVDVGAGTIDFGKIFAKAKPKHVFVEHDNPTIPLQSAQASYQSLRALKF